MKFFIDHDWQENMQTPNKNLGERTKIKSLLFLSITYLIFGLINHSPWRPIETHSFSILIDIIFNKKILTPIAATDLFYSHPPLYEMIGGAFTLLFNFLDTHNAARIGNIFWVGLTMLSIGLSNRELWGHGYGRQSNLIFISSIGLVLNIHSFHNEIAVMTAMSLLFYAFTLHVRRPFRSSVLLAFGLTTLFLTIGFSSLFIFFIICLLLLTCPNWRNYRFFIFLLIGFIAALIPITMWSILIHNQDPNKFFAALKALNNFDISKFQYYLLNLTWFAWPALPLAIFVTVKNYMNILSFRRFQLPLVFLISYLIFLSINGPNNQIHLITFLPFLSIIASGSIDRMNRTFSNSITWFGILIFGSMIFLLLLGWFVMICKLPYSLYERMFYLSGNYNLEINLISISISSIILFFWIKNTFTSKITNRSALTHWSISILTVWTLISFLWFPMIENRKNYGQVFDQIKDIPEIKSSCINHSELSDGHIELIDFYTRIRLQNNYDCKYLITYVNLNSEKDLNSYSEYQMLWNAKMPYDKKSFVLYRKN
ncbi:MAG: hypothetical protein VW238_01540 [Nitrosomonadales bacterium]